MKRSEMISLIADELEDMYDSWDSGGYTVFESRAKRLLQKIEDAGMLPPSTNLAAFDRNDNAWEPDESTD